MNRILVTGGWGFIGSNLIRRLVNLGYHVITIDNIGPNKYFADLLPKVNWINDNLSNIQKYNIEVDGVFHLAGKANVKESVINPMDDMKSNLLNTVILLEWARQKQLKRFVFSSSVSVLGSNITNPVTESIAANPRSPYGASKLASEGYCISYHESYKVPTIVSRLFNVYGPGQSNLFVSDIIYKLLKNNHSLDIWGGGLQIRDYLYITDLIDGLVLLYEKGQNGNIYNLASGRPIMLKDIALKIAYEMGDVIPKITNHNKTYTGDVDKWYANISKINELGFYPKTSLEDGIRIISKWYLDNSDWLFTVKESKI